MVIETEKDYNKALTKFNIMKDQYQDNDEQKEFYELNQAIYRYEEEQRGGLDYPNSHLY